MFSIFVGMAALAASVCCLLNAIPFLLKMLNQPFMLNALLYFGILFSSCQTSGTGTSDKEVSKETKTQSLSEEEVTVYQTQLAHFFDSILLRGRFSGGILVAKGGQILYEQYKGFSDWNGKDTVHQHTPFHIASTSKTFTSTAILQLMREGRLSLDDSLDVYFPLFPYKGITVRHLLTHSSGLPNYAYLFPKYKWPAQKTATNTDVLHLFYTWRPSLDFTTGARFNYCNTNFVLLALIVEKVTGESFPNYVRDHIFIPSGMMDTYIVGPDNASQFMPSWNGNGRRFDFNNLDAIYGDKNVFSTCRDLLRYDSAIANNILLPERFFDSAWTPYFRDKKYRDTIEHYGLGWRLKIFNDTLKIPYHNGWWHGNNAVFQRLVADDAVIILTGNRFNPMIYQAAKAANVFRRYYKKEGEEAGEEEEVQAGGNGGN